MNILKGKLDVEEVILKEKISQQQNNKKEFDEVQKQLNELHKKIEIKIENVEESILEGDIEQQERELNKIKEVITKEGLYLLLGEKQWLIPFTEWQEWLMIKERENKYYL